MNDLPVINHPVVNGEIKAIDRVYIEVAEIYNHAEEIYNATKYEYCKGKLKEKLVNVMLKGIKSNAEKAQGYVEALEVEKVSSRLKAIVIAVKAAEKAKATASQPVTDIINYQAKIIRTTAKQIVESLVKKDVA